MKNFIRNYPLPTLFRTILPFLWRHRYHSGAILLLICWSYPLIATGNKLEWGDFSFFSQAYEAMRISILDYQQFPWFNPWIAGGVPLYANPQIGLFSPQMVLVLIVGAPVGIKLAVALYTLLGYAAMYVLLHRYFKIDALPATLLSLLWVLCSFFVSHLPYHFTFVWYLLLPYFIYLALTIKNWKGGLLLGGLFVVMALSQIHNPFVHIALVCGVIIAVRLCIKHVPRRDLLLGLAAAAGVFVVIAGHRLLMVYENVKDFPRALPDMATAPQIALLGLVLPTASINKLEFINYPVGPYGFIEVSATLGIGALVAAFLCFLYIAYRFSIKQSDAFKQFGSPLLLLGIALLCLLIALGNFAPWAPYNIVKLLPVLADMRVSTRWLLGVDLALLIFIGLMIRQSPKQSFLRFAVVSLLSLGVLQLFLLNLGYQKNALFHQPIIAPKNITAYSFEQTGIFGEERQLPTGDKIPYDGALPASYREYEATLYNLGVLYANDALLQLPHTTNQSVGRPTCPIENDCRFIHTRNAKVISWSPHKIILERTGPGEIRLNMNNSNYFVINGQRNDRLKVAEAYADFTVQSSEETKLITIEVVPDLRTVFIK